jgi:hypothetical protein
MQMFPQARRDAARADARAYARALGRPAWVVAVYGSPRLDCGCPIGADDEPTVTVIPVRPVGLLARLLARLRRS